MGCGISCGQNPALYICGVPCCFCKGLNNNNERCEISTCEADYCSPPSYNDIIYSNNMRPKVFQID